jgi:hypothetical protein
MLAQPVLDTSIVENITKLSGALVVPPPKGDANRAVQKSGVLDADGAFVPNSITWRNTNQFNLEPPRPEAANIKTLPGSYMFAGPLFGHFGHFLVESICRLWAVDHLKDKINGILFVPKFQSHPQRLMDEYRPLIKMLGVDVPCITIEDPTCVETLYVPQQGFGMFEMIEGAPEFRDWVKSRGGKGVTPQGAKKIYVSRSALPPARGGLLGEKRLEALLEAEGYSVFHPQKHKFEQQIAAYKAATHIISMDGSPLHMAALVCDVSPKVACIARRAGDLDQYFARQLKSFQDIETTTISALVQNWIPETHNRPSRLSYGEADFRAIYDELKAGGFITGTIRWDSFNDSDRDEMVAELAAFQNVVFKAYVKP